MRIKKIFNNNIVLTNEDGKEIICIGKGLAFGKHVGDIVNTSEIEKKYVLDDEKMSDHVLHTLENARPQLTDAVTKIVAYVEEQVEVTHPELLFVSLYDHIAFAIERLKDKIELNAPLEWDIQTFYPTEFALGVEALDIIEHFTGYKLPQREASFLALHFVNAMEEHANNMNRTYQVTKVIDEILSIVNQNVDESIDKKSIHYRRLVTHLKFFAQRLDSADIERGIQAENASTLEPLRSSFPKSANVVEQIGAHVQSAYNIDISDNEQAYLILHISRLIKS